jgi:hypothetical protein
LSILDIEGTFDQSSFETTVSAVRKHGAEPTICRQINSMRENRIIRVILLADTLKMSTSRRCPQEGICHPYCRVSLQMNFSGDAVDYADDS